MDTKYDPKKFEAVLYKMWEEGGYFKPESNSQQSTKSKQQPFTILLPLPNANDPMHMGHALFTVQDILIRYHRMLGDFTLWLPGGDHAGIETQFVFEKHLAKEGKSRFDFDRKTLYQMIEDFVEENKNTNKEQMKELGFSLDWSRYHYSLEPKIIEIVFDTFCKLHRDGFVYRADRVVNYCTFCGTAFSDLEVNYVEKDEQLYYLDYGPIQIATTRPETIFADVAVAVNPKDKRYKNLVGQQAVVPLINKKIPIICNSKIEIKFGTGALKVTPAHNKLDFEIGKHHKLPVISCIETTGRMKNVPKELENLFVRQAKKKTLALLEKEKKLLKVEALHHNVGTCYRCKNVIEPLPIPQWYVRTKPLAEPAIEAVKNGQTKIEPLKRFEKMYFDWMNKIEDWNISRQIVWGPQIPVWYCLDCNPEIVISFLTIEQKLISEKYTALKSKYSLKEILTGLQAIKTPVEATYMLKSRECRKCHGHNLIQETDTFDTWFLSGQWPFTTLKNSKPSDFETFYPTSILDTMWDILFFWVARMMMLGIYRTGKAPFKVIHLHARVVDKIGQKMSKSKGNVLNPIEMVEKYGADALRASLVFGVAPGSDVVVSEDKIRSMRNFANKLWNIGRFIKGQKSNFKTQKLKVKTTTKNLKLEESRKILQTVNKLIKSVTTNVEKYRFDLAFEELYHFTWHEFADNYIEWFKKNPSEESFATLNSSFVILLKLLHPFMPFVTEAIWQKMPRKYADPLIISSWPNLQ